MCLDICVCLWHVHSKVYYIPWKLHENGRDGHITLIAKLLSKHCEDVCLRQRFSIDMKHLKL